MKRNKHFCVNLESNSAPQFLKTKYSETTVIQQTAKLAQGTSPLLIRGQ